MSLENEIHEYYSRDHWITVSVEIPSQEAHYRSESVRRVEEWCERNAKSEAMVQPAIYGADGRLARHGRIIVRFFYGDDPKQAKDDAILCRLWLR